MKTYAFLDEYGDPSLNLESSGASTHYIIVAVIVAGDALVKAQEGAELVRRAHFGQGEMKSSGVGTDDPRRLRILSDIAALPISYFVFVADKGEIWKSSGLIYKRPFIKFLSGKVYHKLFKTFRSLDAVADHHGNVDFMDGVKRYVSENHMPELFEDMGSRFDFADSKTNVLIQVADMVAGSFGKIFDQNRGSQYPDLILKTLKPLLTGLDEWPPVYRSLRETADAAVGTNLDNLVRHYCVDSVKNYLAELDEADEDTSIREATLNFLLERALYEDENDYILGEDIVTEMNRRGHLDFRINALRSKVINHFRDNDVIIGSDQNGYKIPTAVEDIMDYVRRCETVVPPLISRLKRARDSIRIISHNELDILRDFGVLKAMTETFQIPPRGNGEGTSK